MIHKFNCCTNSTVTVNENFFLQYQFPFNIYSCLLYLSIKKLSMNTFIKHKCLCLYLLLLIINIALKNIFALFKYSIFILALLYVQAFIRMSNNSLKYCK
jgi:hypothetical protein